MPPRVFYLEKAEEPWQACATACHGAYIRWGRVELRRHVVVGRGSRCDGAVPRAVRGPGRALQYVDGHGTAAGATVWSAGERDIESESLRGRMRDRAARRAACGARVPRPALHRPRKGVFLAAFIIHCTHERKYLTMSPLSIGGSTSRSAARRCGLVARPSGPRAWSAAVQASQARVGWQ